MSAGSVKGKQLQICSYYSPELAADLKALAKAMRRTLADCLREAAEDLVHKHAAALRKARANARGSKAQN